MKYYVYALVTTRCNKRYIGITTNPERRLRQHKSVEDKMWKTLTKCGRAVKRYGAASFSLEIKGTFITIEEAANFECELIKRFGVKRLWNSSKGGEGRYGQARKRH